jgi:hypothetical protein
MGEVADRISKRIGKVTQPTPEIVDEVRMEVQSEHLARVDEAIKSHATDAARYYKVDPDDVFGEARLKYAEGHLLRGYNPARGSLRTYLNRIIWSLARRQPGAVLPPGDGRDAVPVNSAPDESPCTRQVRAAPFSLGEVEDQAEFLSDRVGQADDTALVHEWLKQKYSKRPLLFELLIAYYSDTRLADLTAQFGLPGDTPEKLSRLICCVKRNLRNRFNPDTRS